MIDELDLAFDEHAERGQTPAPAGCREREEAAAAMAESAVAFLMVFILLGGSAAAVLVRLRQDQGLLHRRRLRRRAAPTVQVTDRVKDATLTDIGNTLVDADVVKSTKAFIEAADANPAEQEHPARHLQAAQADGGRAAR